MSQATSVKTSNHYGAKEPYRYCCPECEATRSRIHKRVGDSTRYYYADDPEAPLYCNSCETALYALYDKKEDCERQFTSREKPSGGVRNTLGEVSIYEEEL